MNTQSKYYCYIIRSTNPAFSNSTYNGSTNNLVRRLRQHNREITGGAKATAGKKWEFYAVLTGFKSYHNALSCEWRIKHPTNSRKRPPQYNGVKGRIKSLGLLVGLDCWTNQSSGMENGLDYKLYLDENLLEYVNLETKKYNLEIKKLNDLII